jgi:hypothetical protein
MGIAGQNISLLKSGIVVIEPSGVRLPDHPRTPPRPSVALYWDFENLHAALVEERGGDGAYAKPDARFRVQEPLVDVAAVVALAAGLGPLAINRAYANWQYLGRYRDALLQGAIDLVQMFPPGASAKNGADIRLSLDAVEDAGRLAHVGTVVVVGGDSDFMPLSHKLKAAGIVVVGVGARANTNRHWARSCHAFHYYDTLAAAQPVDSQADDPDATVTLPAPPEPGGGR